MANFSTLYQSPKTFKQYKGGYKGEMFKMKINMS